MADGNVIKQFIDSVKEPEFESNKANLAVVSRVDSEGIVWVHLAGAQKETPTASTSSEVKSGDVVSVEWRNNKLYICGNYSNPSAGVIRVGMAENTASVAYEAAENAIYDAGRAREAADQAEASAQSALTSANQAKQSADNANTQATYATNYANNALIQLSTVESVVDALTWISEHSVFIPTTDTTVQTSKLYYMPANNTLTLTSGTTTINGLTFAVDAESGTVTVNGTASEVLLYSVGVPNVTTGDTIYISGCSGGTSSTYGIRYGNEPGSYACYDGTTKATATEGKPIYIKFTSGYTATDLVFTPTVSTANDGFEYKIVQNPTGNPSAQGWYELSTDEAVKTYVKSHLALTDDGLYVLNGSSAYKMLLANDGTYIQAPNGTTVNQSTADGNVIRATNGDVIAHLGYGEGASQSGTATAPYYTLGTRVNNSTVGNYSMAEGTLTTASGPSSHAEGMNTTASGSSSHAEGYRTTASGISSHAEGTLTKASGLYSHAEGDATTASEPSSHAEGDATTASGYNSHAEGDATTASGYNSHAEGDATTASGYNSHAEGSRTTASGDNSHAEGMNTKASGISSHAEGIITKASGLYSHAEGMNTTASGDNSHAGGRNTIAQRKSQTVIGEYNNTDTTGADGTVRGDYAFIIGNGTADKARSNALTVDWNGNVNIASGAHYKINGTNLSASDVSAVALSDKYTRSSAGDLGWTNQTDGNVKVIAKSALAFWNGAYSGNSSNLSKCSAGTIIGSNGGTMTGQLLTSYKSSVAMGSYGSAQTTVGGLVGEVRYSSGCAGSANITTAYTADGVTISTGWYNFMYMPHRSGGKNGATDGDNVQYGNLFLFGMNNTNGRFVVRVSSGSIAEVVKLVTTADIATTTATPSITTSTGTLVASSIARSGKLRTLFLRVKNSSAINAGSNVYVGTLSTTSDRPAVWANGVGYYGSVGIMFQLKDTGEITGRVIGAQLSANGEVYASLTYVVS